MFGILALGAIYAGTSLVHDLMDMGPTTTILPFILLGVALLIALGFEFVNGFHDTANAVATVIYTHSLPPHVAVVWSGIWNFLGVLVSTGAVAFGIVSLLPVELILQVGSGAGFAMVFALLIAAIIWNLGTWYLGLPVLELAHADRLDHRRRPRRTSSWRAPTRHQRRRLGPGRRTSASRCCSRRSIGFVAARRCCCCSLKVVVRDPDALRGARRRRSRRRSGSAAC